MVPIVEDEPDLVVSLRVPATEEELAADRLWQAGATAVSLATDGDGVVLTASMPTRAAVAVVAAEVGGTVVEVDPSWRDAWRAHAGPVVVGRLVVAPGWRDVPVPGGLVLRIDPGGAFGSGTHASTRMVLAALDAHPPAGLAVADIGCGSGVLSVAAARLGAASVVAVDIDPEAVASTRANASASGVADLVSVSATPVAALVGAVEADLALVNVTAAVHATLGPSVSSLVRRGGRVVVAGLLPGQWRHVAGAYAGCSLVSLLALDGWEGAVLARG